MSSIKYLEDNNNLLEVPKVAKMNSHAANLKKICRICADLLSEDKCKYVAQKLEKRLRDAFFIDIQKDVPSVHPDMICHRCY